MKSYITNATVVLIAIVALLFAASFAYTLIARAAGNDGPGRKIVVWKEGVSDARKAELLDAHGRKIKDLALVHASVAEIMSASDVQALKLSSEVVSVDDDPVAVIAVNAVREEGDAKGNGKNRSDGAVLGQVLPWGIDQIDAEKVWLSGNTGNPIKVGVIDTGISSAHPELALNIKGGVNTINPRKSWNDDNGHGSHVSGIIAALDNGQGVVGGASNADLYAIKVLNSSGSGYYSDIIEGIDWAISHHLNVVNMSLGGSTDYQPFHDAITAARNAGIVIVAAAGNSGGSVGYPAAYREVIAVSAIDSLNNVAAWSSRGPEVDLAAPGVSIYSTYKGTGYATMSGTSMAAPHVAASAALLMNTPVGSHDTNANGVWDPAEVQTQLQNTAVDAGPAGYDTLFGFGMVNAFAALQ